jgi:CRP-like cAMP-binding protein
MTAKSYVSKPNRPPPANHLLAALPPEVFGRLSPSIKVIPLELKRFLYKASEPIREVYFPGGGFCSMVTVLKNGAMVEVATVGREGMLGMSAVLNRDTSPSATMVQAETDTCYAMSTDAFREEMDRREAFYDLLTPLRAGPCRLHHAIDGLQRHPLRRAPPRAVAATGAGSRWEK